MKAILALILVVVGKFLFYEDKNNNLAYNAYWVPVNLFNMRAFSAVCQVMCIP